jgi:dihydrofolate synthase/folylpolyglutamate synthase
MDAAGAIKDLKDLKKGSEHASIPGRFQVLTYRGRTIVLDGAHNPDAAKVLAKSLDAQFGATKVVLVTNMLVGHEPSAFYEILQDRVAGVHVVPVDFHRATPVEKMVGKLKPIFSNVTGFESPIGGLNAAVDQARKDEIVLVTGTFYLVGELLRELT